MVSNIEACSTKVVVTLVIGHKKMRICCEDSLVGTFRDLVNRLWNELVHHKLFIRLTTEVRLTVRWKVGLGAHLV